MVYVYEILRNSSRRPLDSPAASKSGGGAAAAMVAAASNRHLDDDHKGMTKSKKLDGGCLK